MLNRRLLRIKAMQRIYAFRQSRDSFLDQVIQEVSDRYRDEIYKIGLDQKHRLKDERDVINNYIRENQFTDINQLPPHEDEKVFSIAERSLRDYHRRVERDVDQQLNRMLQETSDIYSHYLLLLKLAGQLADLADQRTGSRTYRVKTDSSDPKLKALLNENEVLSCLTESKELQSALSRNPTRSTTELVNEVYLSLKKDEEFLALFTSEKADFSTQKSILSKLLKDKILLNPVVEANLEEVDLNYQENQRILRSMLNKTVKDIEEGCNSDQSILALSSNWEEDKEFFIRLFKKTLEKEQELQPIINEKLKKWASDRVARIDEILMHMALTEMIEFPGIPVKVSINEYLEVGKKYSTPKSAKFINGILDALTTQLVEEKVIRKSGRGLLDVK